MTTFPKSTKPARRMARPANSVADSVIRVKPPSKLDQVEALLKRDAGVSIAEIITATGWQQHSVRGAMAGALRKRGLLIIDSSRAYRSVNEECHQQRSFNLLSVG